VEDYIPETMDGVHNDKGVVHFADGGICVPYVQSVEVVEEVLHAPRYGGVGTFVSKPVHKELLDRVFHPCASSRSEYP